MFSSYHAVNVIRKACPVSGVAFPMTKTERKF